MIETKPTLKEYLSYYQNNKSIKGNINLNQLSFQGRLQQIEDKFDLIKNILKENLGKSVYDDVCKQIECTQILVAATIDESRTISRRNDQGSLKTIDTKKNTRRSENYLRLIKQNKSSKQLSESSNIEESTPQSLPVIPLEPTLLSQNLLQPSPETIGSFIRTDAKSYYCENNSYSRMELLLETMKKPVQEFYVIPKLKKEEDEELLDFELSRDSKHVWNKMK